jgi:hypothetical protein
MLDSVFQANSEAELPPAFFRLSSRVSIDAVCAILMSSRGSSYSEHATGKFPSIQQSFDLIASYQGLSTCRIHFISPDSEKSSISRSRTQNTPLFMRMSCGSQSLHQSLGASLFEVFYSSVFLPPIQLNHSTATTAAPAIRLRLTSCCLPTPVDVEFFEPAPNLNSHVNDMQAMQVRSGEALVQYPLLGPPKWRCEGQGVRRY